MTLIRRCLRKLQHMKTKRFATSSARSLLLYISAPGGINDSDCEL
jgi:hypothetical protein